MTEQAEGTSASESAAAAEPAAPTPAAPSSELATTKPVSYGFFGTLRRMWRMFWITTWTYWVVTIHRIKGTPPEGTHAKGLRFWARGARRILGVDFRVVSGAASEPTKARLIVANHRTPLDIIPIDILFGGHFLANHKTRTAPVVGIAAEMVGTIFVDREDRRSGANAIRTMKRYLEEKRTVIVFPEGTTYGGDEVRPFQRGAFLAAKGLDVEIIPVGIAYPPGHEFTGQSLGAHARGFLSRASNRAWISIGEPIPAELVVKDEEQVRRKVQELVDRSRAVANAETRA